MDHAEVPVGERVADEQERGAGQRALDLVRKQVSSRETLTRKSR